MNWTVVKVWGKFRDLVQCLPHIHYTHGKGEGPEVCADWLFSCGRTSQINEGMGNTWRYYSICDLARTRECTWNFAWTSLFLCYFNNIRHSVFFIILLREASQHNNKQNNRQPWLKINNSVKVWMHRCDRELPRARVEGQLPSQEQSGSHKWIKQA